MAEQTALQHMSDQALDEAMEACIRTQQQCQQQQQAIKQQALQAQKLYDELAAEKSVRVHLQRMSAAEQQALLQRLTGAGGIDSHEQSGIPGRV